MERPSLERIDDYEAMASTWQVIQIMELNTALRQCGISDAKKRRRICEVYFEQLSDIADRCAFKFRNQYVYPMLCFSPDYLYEENELEDISKLFVRSKGWYGHEQFGGNIAEVFSDIFKKIRPRYRPFTYPDDESPDEEET